MGFFGPNVEKMKKARDHKGLQRLLYHEKPEIELAAAKALMQIGYRYELREDLVREALKDTDPEIRQEAARRLGFCGTKFESCEALVRALSDSDAGVRRNAIEALGDRAKHGMKADWFLKELIAALEHPDAEIRKGAAHLLGELPFRTVGKHLLTHLGDPTPEVRTAISLALQQLKRREVKDNKEWWESQVRDHLPALIAYLGSGYTETQDCAMELLYLIRDSRVVEPLIGILGSPRNNDLRAFAARFLGELGDPRATQAIIACLKEEDHNLRYYSAGALGNIGDPRGTEPMIVGLSDDAQSVRLMCAIGLGKVGDPRAVDPLTATLTNQGEDKDVRAQAAESLGKIGDQRSFETLVTALSDQDAKVRSGAAWGLRGLRDPRSFESLVSALTDTDPYVRFIVASALGVLCDRRAIDPLITALRDPDERVRGAAANSLGDIGDPKALPALELAVQQGWNKDTRWRKPVAVEASEAIQKIERARGQS